MQIDSHLVGATKDDKSLRTLTPAQLVAIEVLARGGTHDEAANAAGVHRVTVTTWANHHPAVIAELNAIRVARATTMRSALVRVTERALEVVEKSVDAGNEAAAFKWLRMVPSVLSDPPFEGPSDPDAVIEGVRLRMKPAIFETMGEIDRRTKCEAEQAIKQRLG